MQLRAAFGLASQINVLTETRGKQDSRKQALDETVGRAAKTYLTPGLSDNLAENSQRGQTRLGMPCSSP